MMIMDSRPLSPIESEFATAEEAEAYDVWFRAKVEAAMRNTGPGIPHDEVMAHVRQKILNHQKRRRSA